MTAPTLLAASTEYPHNSGTCPPWCDGNCHGWSDDAGWQYHGSQFVTVPAAEHRSGQTGIDVSTSRLDGPDGIGEPQIHLMTGTDSLPSEDWLLTPGNARRLAAYLLNAADRVEPLPAGEVVTLARDIRTGDDLLTPDGWQHVYMVLIDDSADHAAAFTPERNDTDGDGWQFTLTTSVTVRRGVAA